jgi:beta-galactosidase
LRTKDFPELPKDFASQRRTFSPIKGTNDWKLFQTFRYGKDKLKYEFDVPDGEYLVELYFSEPWLGIGGGMKASGMRLFDVVINGKTVLNDLDIWTEVGTNTALKKVVKAKAINGKIIISFPESKAGQAVINAIAIASLNKYVTNPENLFIEYQFKSWLDIGDKQFPSENIVFTSLPSNLYGSDWVSFTNKNDSRKLDFVLKAGTDVFVAIKKGNPPLIAISDFENTGTEIKTDENMGTTYTVYKKRIIISQLVFLDLTPECIVIMQPANNMQPAYDLKPIVQYKTNVVKLSEGADKDSANGRYCSVVKTNNGVGIEYPIQIGAADIYSITMKYFYGKEQPVKGKLQLIGPGNTMMLTEEVSFTFTRDGKWNQFTINTGSQINAGNYIVRLIIDNAKDLAISGIDVQ